MPFFVVFFAGRQFGREHVVANFCELTVIFGAFSCIYPKKQIRNVVESDILQTCVNE